VASPQTDSPKVFMSYSHDSPYHKERVLQLSDRLREEGMDCELDRYQASPPEGWPRWMKQQIAKADFVLVVCTAVYHRRFEGEEGAGKGKGVKWEGAILTEALYFAEADNRRFVPVVFSADDSSYIPTVLRSVTYYDVSTEEGYEGLYRHLTRQPPVVKPNLGQITVMPPRPAPERLRASPKDADARKYPSLSEAIHTAPVIEVPGPNGGMYIFHVFPFGDRGLSVDHALRREIRDGLVEQIRSFKGTFGQVVSVEPGGSRWAPLVADRLGLPLAVIGERPTGLPGEFWVHQTSLLYDRHLFFRGFQRGDEVVVLDDVISTGETIRIVIDALNETGVRVKAVFCIVTKGRAYRELEKDYDLPVHALIKLMLA